MYLDVFTIIVLLYALFKGWSSGFLKEIVSLFGFIIGFIVACLFYGALGKYLTVSGSELNMVTSIVAFLILWVVVPIALGTVSTILTKALNSMAILGLPNRIGGAIVSMLKYLLLLSLVLNVMCSLHILSEQRKHDSRLLEPVTSFTSIVTDAVINTGSKTLVTDRSI